MPSGLPLRRYSIQRNSLSQDCYTVRLPIFRSCSITLTRSVCHEQLLPTRWSNLRSRCSQWGVNSQGLRDGKEAAQRQMLHGRSYTTVSVTFGLRMAGMLTAVISRYGPAYPERASSLTPQSNCAYCRRPGWVLRCSDRHVPSTTLLGEYHSPFCA